MAGPRHHVRSRHGDGDTHRLGYQRVDADPNVDVLLAAMDETAGWDATLRLRSWSEHISASSLANDCSTWAAASGRQRSRSPRISAKAGRSSASTSPRACCASPFQRRRRALSRALHRWRCVLPRRARRFLRRRAVERTSSGSPTPQPRSPRWCGWCAGGRVSLIDTDWSTFTIDVGDDNSPHWSATDANGAPAPVQRRPATARPRGAAGCVPLARTEATQTWTTWTRTSRRRRLAASRWRASPTTSSPAVGWRRPTASGSCDDPGRRATRSLPDAPDDVRGRRLEGSGVDPGHVGRELAHPRTLGTQPPGPASAGPPR